MAVTEQYPLPSWMYWQALPVPLDEDVMANSMARKVEPSHEVPCRRCLQDIKVGDEVVLMSYNPFVAASPYTQTSPIFVHGDATKCQKFDQTKYEHPEMPQQQRNRPLSVRAFNNKHIMINAELSANADALDICKEMLAPGSDVEYVHLHYARYGCFAVRVGRK